METILAQPKIFARRGHRGVIFKNRGYCNVCMDETEFVANHEWLRDFYLCVKCGTCPRQRATVEVLNYVRPDWRNLTIHESSPCINFFAEQCKGYTASHLFENVELGSYKDGSRCENLECLTFEDELFDIFITQDVMEHVFRPDKVLREVMRVLKTGGVHIFTAPKHKDLLKSHRRAKQKWTFLDRLLGRTGRFPEPDFIKHIHSPVYHGNPIGDGKSLVTWDYGADFDDLIKEWSGYNVSTFVIRDRKKGIDGEFLEVFVLIKDELNRIGSILNT